MATLDEGEARALLDEERVRLQQIRMALSGESPDGMTPGQALDELSLVDQHPSDVGTETFERERDRTILEHVDAQLADVDRAAERLELGAYGLCEACGRPIDADRLRARPAARFCVADQARVERSA
jgi:RNA polymerase-binding transcription factor DksA